MYKFRSFLLGGCLVAASACASLPGIKSEPSALLVGNWDNSAQMLEAPESLKRPPVAGGAYEWLDGQYATFFKINAPALTADGSQAVYLVWRAGGPTGAISRQRLWVFRKGPAGENRMDFYAFKDPKAFENVDPGTRAFKSLTLEDLTVYGPLCSLPVIETAKGWRAAIPPTCSIQARSGRKMVLSAEIVLDGDNLSYSEQGTLESGALAFKVPGQGRYQFVRTVRAKNSL